MNITVNSWLGKSVRSSMKSIVMPDRETFPVVIHMVLQSWRVEFSPKLLSIRASFRVAGQSV